MFSVVPIDVINEPHDRRRSHSSDPYSLHSDSPRTSLHSPQAPTFESSGLHHGSPTPTTPKSLKFRGAVAERRFARHPNANEENEVDRGEQLNVIGAKAVTTDAAIGSEQTHDGTRVTGESKEENEVDETVAAAAVKAKTLTGWRFVIKKLFTKEDPVMFHKVFGIFALISFVYRYAIHYNRKGTLGLGDGSFMDWVTFFAHFMLSASSLIFHVLRKRIVSKPLIIYEEYRLHAIVFSMRCVSLFLYDQFRPAVIAHTMYERVAVFALIMAHHVVVDEITRKHGTPSVTAVRNQDKQRWQGKAVFRFYSFYQFMALAAFLVPSDRMSDAGWNSLIAIQSSAFLMTLCRKGLILWYTHMIGYAACLVLSMYHIMQIHPSGYFLGGVVLAFLARTQLGLNKYVIWTLFVSAAAALHI